MLLISKSVSPWTCSHRSCCARRPGFGPNSNAVAISKDSKQKPGVVKFRVEDEALDDETLPLLHKLAVLKAALKEVAILEKRHAAHVRTQRRHKRTLLKAKRTNMMLGRILIHRAASQVTELVTYADERMSRGFGLVSQEPTTAMPGPNPQTFQELPTLLQGTQWGSYFRDLVGGDTVDDSCAKLDNLTMLGGCRSDLAFLDWEVDRALLFDMPKMEARGPDEARAIRLLRVYKTKIRPLLAAALSDDKQGNEQERDECARGLQAVRDEYLAR